MTKILFLNQQTLVDIADAVREKTGNEDLITIGDLDDAVRGISGGGESGGVDLDSIYYFYIGSNSSLENLSGIKYSTDYGKTWSALSFGMDPYGEFSYSAQIEVNKGVNMYVSSDATEKYGVVLLKSSSVISSLTTPNTGQSVLKISDVFSGYLLMSKEYFANFTITTSAAGGAD